MGCAVMAREREMMARFWMGAAPEKCDICGVKIARVFVDGVTRDGRWGIMCPTCRIEEGRIKLGTGLGQKYEARGVGEGKVWEKTEG